MLKFTLYPALPYRVSRVRSTTADKAPSAGMRHFVKWCLLCVLVFCSGSAFAASCSNIAGGNYVRDIGTVTIPTGATVGSVVIAAAPQAGGAYSITCTGDAGQDRAADVTFRIAVDPVSGYTDVYPTNLNGLGVRYNFGPATNGDAACGMINNQHIVRSSYTIRCFIPANTATTTTTTKHWGTSTEFVKTGVITGGALTSIPAVTMSYVLNNQAGSSDLTTMYTGVTTGNAVTPTCTTPDVVIPMGNVNFATFNRTGVANDKWNNATFNVSDCPAGLNRVTIKFDTPTAGWLDETNGVFKLNSPTDAATAKGIGIQMSFGANNALVTYNTAQTLSGYDAIKTTGGTFSVPIGARYVKPASTTKLVAGQANGSVAFIMSYE